MTIEEFVLLGSRNWGDSANASLDIWGVEERREWRSPKTDRSNVFRDSPALFLAIQIHCPESATLAFVILIVLSIT